MFLINFKTYKRKKREKKEENILDQTLEHKCTVPLGLNPRRTEPRTEPSFSSPCGGL